MTGRTAAELAARVGLTARAIRYYVERRVLPPPIFRGVGTTYDEEHEVRLRAIAFLRKERKMGLAAIGQMLGHMTLEEIRALVPAPPAPQVPQPAAGASPNGGGTAAIGARWTRLEVLPGLELHLADDASSLVKRIAREMAETYGPPAAPPSGQGAGVQGRQLGPGGLR